MNLEKPDSANYCSLITYINGSGFTTAFWKYKKLSTKALRQQRAPWLCPRPVTASLSAVNYGVRDGLAAPDARAWQKPCGSPQAQRPHQTLQANGNEKLFK